MVELRPLQEAVVTRGEIVAEGSMPLNFSASVDVEGPVITKVHLSPGAQLVEGQVVVEVSARPVFALQGSLPAYRDLKEGDEGEDVTQLQAALVRLGYMANADGHFGPATARAVRRLYERDGFAPVEIEVEPNNDQVPASSTTTAPNRLTVVMPRAELIVVPSMPATVRSVAAAVGAAPGDTVAEVMTGGLVVRAQLTTTQAATLQNGATAVVDGPGTDVRFDATLEGLAAVTTPQDDTEGDPADGSSPPDSGQPVEPGDNVGVVLRPASPLPPELAGLNLRITITTVASQTPQLVVPVTAVSEAADGTAIVTVLDSTGEPRAVPVETLNSAGGLVAVAGDLSEGDRVVVG
jgi:peptidoglycan hydrolase-like protein with peptidoglycan-binding domain